MKECLQFYINGEWIDPISANNMPVINPSNEEVISTISLGSEADVEAAITAAKDAFKHFSQTPRKERIALLENIVSVYERRYDEMAALISDEMGAPLTFAKEAQAACGPGHLNATLEALKTYPFDKPLGSTHLVKEPVGVCGMITPWNWPVNQIACKVAPALATGCTMVLKPSELSPLSAYLFAQILDEAGVPSGVFNLVNGDGATVGSYLSCHPDIDMISFTGSTRAGIQVSKAAADTIKRVSLELGGKSANIILSDADLQKAVSEGVYNCFENSGQSCNAPTRMLVPVEKHDEVISIARQAAESVTVGDPRDPSTTIGPVVSELQFKKIQSFIHQAIDEDCQLVSGGLGRPDGYTKGYYVKPTIFANVNRNHTIARQEIFGPVLAIMPYRTEEEAIEIANETPYGLSAYISSNNLETARKIASQLRTGMVHLNGAPTDFNAPFGGYKQSGNGREWGEYGLEEFLEVKAIMGYTP